VADVDAVNPEGTAALGTISAPSTSGASGAAHQSATSARVLWLPVVLCVLLVLVLGMLRVSGSSVSLYGGGRPAAGQARPIRGDEYLQRTTLVVRQVELDFPDTIDLGLGEHETGILTDLPVGTWLAVLRPQALVYHVLDIERAFAIEWWTVLAAPFLGIYWALAAITRRALLPALAGAAVALSPAALWWAIPTMGMSIGFAGACCGALVSSARVRRRGASLALALVAGWMLACLAVVLYLPWIIGTGLLFVPTGLVAWWAVRAERPHDERAPAWHTLVPMGVLAAALVAGFVIAHRDALASIQSTVYPGARSERSGGLDLTMLLSAPFDVFAGRRPVSDVLGTNQSEAASGFAWWLPVLVAQCSHLSLWRWVRSADPVRRAAAATAGATLVLLLWAFVPLPAIVGRVTLFDQVPVERLLLPLAVGGAVLAALVAAVFAASPDERPSPATTAIATSVMGSLTLWAAWHMRVDLAPVSRVGALVLAAVSVAAVIALLRGRGAVAFGVIVAMTAFSTARINPVQVGLGPLLDAPLTTQIADVEQLIADLPDEPGDDRRWVLNGTDNDAYGVLTASGRPLASGLAWYPVEDEWAVLDPEGDDDGVWNRFSRVEFVFSPDDASPVLTAPFPDVVRVAVGACAPALELLDIGVVVSAVPLAAPCLDQLSDDPLRPGEYFVYGTIPNEDPVAE